MMFGLFSKIPQTIRFLLDSLFILCYIYLYLIVYFMPQGRPKTGNHTKMMINFTEEIANELKKRSELGGLPISYQVRTAVQEYLARN